MRQRATGHLYVSSALDMLPPCKHKLLPPQTPSAIMCSINMLLVHLESEHVEAGKVEQAIDPGEGIELSGIM